MSSPRLPPSSFSSSHSTSFASVTDPTLHRQGWRSPRAQNEELRLQTRKIPSRYRSLLRFDALSASPFIARPSGSPAGTSPRSLSFDETRHASPPRAASAPEEPTSPSGDADESNPDGLPRKNTNIDELQWFQHRWLDKHGKNSHLKETREKMALLRRWFESLDADGSGEVGVDELEDPLVSVGLARSRDEVQRLISQVDKDGSGEVTFTEFLRMMNPEKPKRARQRQPLHKAKIRVDAEAETSPSRGGSGSLKDQGFPPRPGTAQPKAHATPPSPSRKTSSSAASGAHTTGVGGSSNPVVKLFEDLQSGKLGDLAIPFPVLITAYRRRMLLNAHMAEDPTARRLGTSVLQALESTRRDGPQFSSPENTNIALGAGHRRGSTMATAQSAAPAASAAAASSAASASPSSYLQSYISTVEAAAEENTRGMPHSARSKSTQLPSL